MGSLQLMILPDPLLFEVNVRNRQSAEFRNPQSRVKQDEDSGIADIVKLPSMVERPEFDKHILSHPDLKFHH